MKRTIIIILFTIAQMYSQFTEISQSFPGMGEGVPCWGDYDNDGDLDLHLSGYNGTTSVVRHNFCNIFNFSLALFTFSKISLADFVQTKGLGFLLYVST